MEPEKTQGAVLTAHQVSVDYPGRESTVSSVDLSLRPGEVVALLGPNGAGKTTLLRALSATLQPSSGSVKVLGEKLSDLKASARARLVSYLPQGGADEGPFTVQELVLMGRFAHGEGRVFENEEDHRVMEQALETFDLVGFRARRLHEISGGERQRVHLARLMCQGARVLLVDEPATALDPKHQRHTLHLLCQEVRGKELAALITLHDPNLAADFADRLVYMVNGEVLASGSAADMLNPTILKQVYGVDYTLMHHPQDQRPFVIPTQRGPGQR